MAANTKQSKLSAKDEECTFTWKIFTSWDYGIANVETAHNKVKCNLISIFVFIEYKNFLLLVNASYNDIQ